MAIVAFLDIPVRFQDTAVLRIPLRIGGSCLPQNTLPLNSPHAGGRTDLQNLGKKNAIAFPKVCAPLATYVS